ncbi:MAG TPA: TonB family protein [Candidatus Baltobacteraceae bacterium]|nr:TonB family protein [Candidatus Baltobacteraceae bacterium]
MVLLGGLVLAAFAASCDPNAAMLLAADRQFTAADTALAKHDAAAAKAAYDSGMQQLAATPWFIGVKACDPPQYTFERYVVSLHSLVLADDTGAVDARTAFRTKNDMWDGITQPAGAPPHSAYSAAAYFAERYPDLFKQMGTYETSLRDRYDAAQIARHSPSANCVERNVPAEYLDDGPVFSKTFIQNAMMYAQVPKGHYEAAVDVELTVDGTVQDAHVTRSSGQRIMDEKAVEAAKALHYLPEIKDCRRAASSYTYNFSTNTTPDIPLHP